MGPRLKSRGVLFSLPPPVFSPGGTRGSCQTKPGTAGWSIPDKSSEVRAVKRLLTSHFICQTFISLFTVQCTSSIRAMLHTCAWTTFRACSPYFSWPHEQTKKKKWCRVSKWGKINTDKEMCLLEWVLFAGALIGRPLWVHPCVWMCIYVYVNTRC